MSENDSSRKINQDPSAMQERFQSILKQNEANPAPTKVSLESVAGNDKGQVAFPAMTGPQADADAKAYANAKTFQQRLAEVTPAQGQEKDGEGKGKAGQEIGKDAELARSINGISRDPNRNRPSF